MIGILIVAAVGIIGFLLTAGILQKEVDTLKKRLDRKEIALLKKL